MQKHEFFCQRVSAGYENQEILHDLTINIPLKHISVLIGSNGCGKSTLLKTLAGFITPYSGKIVLDGKQIHQYSRKQVAQKLSVLPQRPQIPTGLKVIDLVSQGRFPYHSLFSNLNREDEEAIANAMEMMQIKGLAERDVSDLSGGQQQRVWIALALAQQADTIFLDEPTTFLDLAYQVEILDILDSLNKEYGTTIVLILHDINMAARYADYLFAMKKGRIIKEGTPAEVIEPEVIREVFGLNSIVVDDPVAHTPVVVPISEQSENK